MVSSLASSTTPSRTNSDSKWKYSYFEILLALSQVFGFSMICLSGYFFNTMMHGIVWPTTGNPQNLHGFFMITGLVFFQGEALLSYRLYRYDAKILSKFVHVVFHVLAIALFSTALAAALKQKQIDENKNFATVHSWIGLAVMTIYLIQFCFGLINYALPGMSLETKMAFMPYHRIVGCVSFIACAIQSCIGHTQYVILATREGFGCYFNIGVGCKDNLSLIYNFAVISLILYTITVLLIVIPPAWKREKTPDEMK